MVRADENPFRVDRIEALRYRSPEFRWAPFYVALERQQYRGAIVGKKGAGKTTLLLELQARLEAGGATVSYHRLHGDTPQKFRSTLAWLRRVPRHGVGFFDGAEQLSPLAWHCVAMASRRLSGFVISTHRPGRMKTLHEARTSEGLLEALIDEIVPGDRDVVWPRAQAYYRRYDANLRDVFFALYDDYAQGTIGVEPTEGD